MIEAFRNVVFECEKREGGREKGLMTETFRNVAQFSLFLCTYNLLCHNPTIPQLLDNVVTPILPLPPILPFVYFLA